MPPNPSHSGEGPSGKKPSRTVGALVRAERLTQIAFILPAAVFIGWIAGAALDKWLHQQWIYLVGLVLGVVAGFIQVLRLVSSEGKAIDKEDS
ncbi:MAG TPA: AtpZ/AtpI family protein [Acidobacteriaceae bacterium]|jgi:F0F1-type ATP synthase assembly protein I|nr:AtpZ/AtpI family protein [Acidobacteriaceae bacterium]